ncbi:MAG: NAD(+)/NADH kinase [Desulfobacteraceae bacterium]|nr:NAD(+)/NADH kinase [Desulfobacteraceae bacterium]
MKRIGMVVKPDVEARRKADELEAHLAGKGVDVLRRDNPSQDTRQLPPDDFTAPSDLLAVIVLGGDGTFLSAVRWIGDQSIPLLGVKFGELGFLAEASESSLPDVADSILGGRFTTTPRTRLRVTVRCNGRTVGRETVLNDVVINKGALARLADIDTFVDDRYLTTYRADGLILATPTGSTAYSLAAGGPIIHPEVSGIILTPISPFTLTIRPLIVPDSAVVTVRLAKTLSNIMVTFDGQAGFEMEEAHEIVIQKSPHSVHMIDLPGQNYYELLKNKLRWSGSRV